MEDKFNVTVVACVKHGALYKAIKNRGWNQGQTAKFLGVSQNHVSRMINLRALPPFIFNKRRGINSKINRRAKKLCEKLMELTGQAVEDLFPDNVMTEKFLSRSKSVEVNTDISVCTLVGYRETLTLPKSPDDALMEKEEDEELAQLMEELTPEQRVDFEARIFSGLTFRDAAKVRGVHPNRVRANVLVVSEKLSKKWRNLRLREDLNHLLRKSSGTFKQKC